MKDIILRDYQLESIEALRKGIAAGHNNQLLVSPTGSGKSLIATHLIREASRKFSRTAFVVDRISLVDQISAMFDDYGIEHGVIQADHWRYRPYERVQVISSGTLARRDMSKAQPFQLLCYDEAHVLIKSVLDFMADNPNMRVVSLTATPFSRGLSKIYSNVVNVTTTNQLIAEGWLTPLKVYAAKAADMRGAKLTHVGEWEPTEIEKRSLDIIGDIVSGWIDKTNKHFGGPVKTIAFSATVAHGNELCRQFQAAGFNFQQVSYLDGNDDKRRALIAEFRKPDSEIVGLVSCEALGRGFDVPDIRCMIAARPYRKSLSSWVQQIGRAMRPYPGKDYALLLDHSSNWIRFSDDLQAFFDQGIHELNGCDLDSKVRKEPEKKSPNVCKCGYVLSPADEFCPSCGTERHRPRNKTQHKAGELVEIGESTAKPARHGFLEDKDRIAAELWGMALGRKKGDKDAALRFARAQWRALYAEWPSREFVAAREPSPALCALVKHNIIKWVKRREARA